MAPARRIRSAAALDCATNAEFCFVLWSNSASERLICAISLLWLTVAPRIPDMRCATSAACPTSESIVAPACSTKPAACLHACD